MLQDYNAVEPSVREGGTVTVLQNQAGWSLCAAKDGEVGWVPMDKLAAA